MLTTDKSSGRTVNEYTLKKRPPLLGGAPVTGDAATPTRSPNQRRLLLKA